MTRPRPAPPANRATGTPIRLLVLAALRKTLHEPTIAVDLMNQLAAVGVRSHFVIDEFNQDQLTAARIPYTVVHPSMGASVHAVVRDVVHEFRPDAIVLADYLGHWLTFGYGYSDDPWFIDEFDLPIIPIDLYDLENTDRKLEILGKTVEVSDRILGMDLHLQPVPMARPVPTKPGHGRPYRATRTLGPLTTSHRTDIRRTIGLGDGERLLMVPTLPWQQLMREHAGPATRELATRVPELVAHYLGKLPSSTHFLLTGPVFDDVKGLPQERVHLRSSYRAGDYDELLAASDAVMSFHLPSFALERAVFADVPGLLCLNGFDISGPDDVAALDETFGGVSPTVASWLADYPGTLPAFHMWPLRWNSVLAPLLADNPFTDGIARAEILDESAVSEQLHNILHDPSTRARLAARRSEYRDQIDALPPTTDVFLAGAEELGITR